MVAKLWLGNSWGMGVFCFPFFPQLVVLFLWKPVSEWFVPYSQGNFDIKTWNTLIHLPGIWNNFPSPDVIWTADKYTVHTKLKTKCKLI